jgi:hypothetical protein
MSTHALQTAAANRVEAQDSATLDILVKALTAGVATVFTASLGPKVAVLAAVLATIAAEGVRQIVKGRNWGVKRVGFLVTLTVALSQVDAVVGRNARNLLGRSAGASRLLDAVSHGTGQIVLTTTAATTLAVGGYGAAKVVHEDAAPIQKTFHIEKNGIGKLAFEGQAGERVFLKVTGSTIGTADVGLYGADDEKLDAGIYNRGQDSYLNTVTLPTTRTYTVWVDPWGTDTGRLTVKVIKVRPDRSHLLRPTAAGSAITIRTSLGQAAIVRFRGRPGRTVFARFTSSTFDGAAVELVGTDDTTLAEGTVDAGTLEPTRLPYRGEYKLVVDPDGLSAGSVRVNIAVR